MTTAAVAEPAALDAARALLLHHFGYPDFRPAQTKVVRSVLAGRDTLAVLPTGAGKSVCFQIPALLAPGLTVVISPLVALMQDQVDAARARRIAARCLNSLQSRAAQRTVREELAAGALKLLYVAPERCRTLVRELKEAGARVSRLAVDEAHCLAEWGHDFRPAYLGLARFRAAVGHPPVVALTGSATPAVRSEIARGLRLGLKGGYDLHLGSFDRRNLWFGVVRVASERERLRRLVELVTWDDRIAIVYAATRNLTEALARVLRERGIRAAAYHAGLDRERRAQVLEEFLTDRLEVVTATCAFGMGIDKPNVRLVVHWQMPPTPESYYQEAGRAGRDGAPARCVLLYRKGDDELPRRQLAVTFPDRKLVERAWTDPAARAKLPANIAASVERLERELHPRGGRARWDAVEARREAALDRLAAVVAYARGGGCRRAALIGYFGERLVRCSGCDRCRSPVRAPADPAVRRRMARLVAVTRAARAPWSGALLDARTLRLIAEQPPPDIDALAGVPGVGVAVAERLGRALLEAVGDAKAAPAGQTPNDALARLLAWRARRARELGRPPFAVASEALLRRLAATRPGTREALARCEGVGPRFLSVEADDLLAVLRGEPAPAGEARPPPGAELPDG